MGAVSPSAGKGGGVPVGADPSAARACGEPATTRESGNYQGGAGKPLVAIVDDDKSIRDATRDLLKATGTLENAASFLASASRATATCLIADMRMPGMTGLELYEALVASGDGIPTVLITAHPEDVTQSRARQAGITCYLSKPFAPDDLLGCVRAAWRNRRPGLYQSLNQRSPAEALQALRTTTVYLGAMSGRAARA